MAKVKWYTREEEDFIRKNFQTMTCEEIADRLGRKKAGIQKKAERLGLIKILERKYDLEPFENELWRDVPNYEGLYMVSSIGRVKSIRRKNSVGRYIKEKIFSARENNHGYPSVSIMKNGKSKNVRVHRLVAEAFIPNPDNLPEVNHIDENKSNNRVENLEWVTQQQNITRNDLHIRGGKNRLRSVLQCNEKGEAIKEYESAKCAAQETGFSYDAIKKHCTGFVEGMYKGYYWKYKNGKRNKYTSVSMYDMDWNFIRNYISVKSAARELGVSGTQIFSCINGKASSAYGYKWKKIED